MTSKGTTIVSKNILVVAAHPDDEVLGCGGTVAGLADRGATVKVAFLADGVKSRGEPHAEALPERRAAARLACETIGAAPPHFGDFPDNRLDALPRLQIVQAVEALIRNIVPISSSRTMQGT